MEDLQFYTERFRRPLRIFVEFCVLILSAVFVYLEEFFLRSVMRRSGKSLEGEVILVTGSANGLGKEICRELVKHRAKLVLWDISEDENKKAAEELIALGAEHVYHDTVDVSDKDQVVRAASKMREKVGEVNILVNNAGICPMQQFLELTQEAVQSTFQTNILAHFWTIQEFLPHMLQVNKGHIVTICSTMGQMAIRGPAPYYATKHAVHGLSILHEDKDGARKQLRADTKVQEFYVYIATRIFYLELTNFEKILDGGDSTDVEESGKFPSITPFMEASDVAKRIVDGIRHESEFLYIPETFRIYLAGFFLLPSKLHRRCIDFFVEESAYSVEFGNVNGYTAAAAINSEKSHENHYKSSLVYSKSENFGDRFATTTPSWLSGNVKEKEK